MHGSYLKLALVGAIFAVHGPAAGQSGGRPLPIELGADSWVIDGRSNLVEVKRPRITQGNLEIEAGEALATSVGFEDSEWRLSGGVRIIADTASIEAQTAVFTFSDNALARTELVGNPAKFSDRGAPADVTATGTANRIEFDYARRRLRMSENARIVKGSNEITGCELTYDFKEERVTAGSSNCGEPLRFRTIPPGPDRERNTAARP